MLCFKHSELTQENVHKIKIVLKYGEENVGEITRQELLGSSWAKSEILKLRTQRGSSDDSGANNNQENDATNKNLAISNLLASPDFESTSITSQFIKIISENGFFVQSNSLHGGYFKKNHCYFIKTNRKGLSKFYPQLPILLLCFLVFFFLRFECQIFDFLPVFLLTLERKNEVMDKTDFETR